MQVSTCWTEQLPLDDSLLFLSGLALEHCRFAGSAGVTIGRLISDKRWHDLVNYDLTYALGANLEELRHARQALGLFQKFENLDLQIDKEAVAYSKFVEAELACKSSNEIFRAFARGAFFMPAVDAKILYRAQSYIRRVLGPVPNLRDLPLQFGPGATTSIRKTDACPSAKLGGRLTCSSELLSSGLFNQLVRTAPHWFQQHEASYTCDEEFETSTFEVDVAPSRLEFVPKNARTYRTIIPQQTLNGLVQAAYGSAMRQRLRAVGVDLRDQSKNRLAAQAASISGDQATLDLRSASDSICYWLVKFLLPADWFECLSGCRSSYVSYHDACFVLEQFSSMGNGVTFPLQSLLFFALTRSACADVCPDALGDICVYGDDIICPTSAVDNVVRVLQLCGFSINPEKSFVDGPFRESCGGDYYLGTDIRPFYQKHLVSGATLFTLHNFYVRNSLHSFAEYVKSVIPVSLRLYGPDGYGDGHLVSEWWPEKPLMIRDGKKHVNARVWGYSGVCFDTYAKSGRSFVNIWPGDYVTPLYSIYCKGRDNLIPESACQQLFGTDRPPELLEASAIEFTPSGRPIWALPSDDDGSYQRKSIYVLR